MTEQRLVDWNGKSYFADPEELTMGELEVISQRSEITGILDMVDRLRRMDHVAWKAIFWAQDRREDLSLKWDGYDGPTMRVLANAAKSWREEEPGAEGKDSATETAG